MAYAYIESINKQIYDTSVEAIKFIGSKIRDIGDAFPVTSNTFKTDSVDLELEQKYFDMFQSVRKNKPDLYKKMLQLNNEIETINSSLIKQQKIITFFRTHASSLKGL